MKNNIAILILLLCTSFIGKAQETTIMVLDQDKKPIPSVHVLVKETEQLLLSDANGKVIISFKDEKNLTLEVSFIGFVKKVQKITPGKNITILLEEDLFSLGAFVVTGQYSESSPEKAVQKITVIDREKIEKMAAVNLRDVLTNEMNVRISQDNILGSGISLQGISGENVKILIDGVPVIGRLDGNIDLSQINLNDIERIEIVEGPMSVSYGTNALAGVINLITKTEKQEQVSLMVNSFNENIGQYNLDGNISYAKKNHSISFSGGRNYFDGWIEGDPTFGEKAKIADSSRFKTWKPKEQLFGKINYNYQFKGGNIKYTLSYFDEKISNKGLPRAPYLETSFDDYYNTKRIDNSVSFNKKIKGNKHLKAIVAYNDYKRIKNTFFKDLTNLEEILTTNLDDQDTSKFNQWVVRSSFTTSNKQKKLNYELGIDFNLEEAFGQRIENEIQRIGDYAAYASVEYQPFQNTIIRPGLRYSYNTDYDAPITPSINVKQSLGKINIRGAYARGFRSPSLKELYFDFVDINHNIVGNPELKAEQSNNFNAAVNYITTIKNYAFKLEVSSFYNKIDNLITLAQGDGTQFSYVNIGDYQTHGIQTSNTISYKQFKLGIGASYIGRYNFLSENNSVDRFSYSTEWRSHFNYEVPKQGLFVSVFYKFTGKLPGFGLDTDGALTQTYIESYHTADLSIGKYFWQKRFQITLGSKNLFNVKNVNSFEQGAVHSNNTGSTSVATGRTYFLKMTFNIHHAQNN